MFFLQSEMIRRFCEEFRPILASDSAADKINIVLLQNVIHHIAEISVNLVSLH